MVFLILKDSTQRELKITGRKAWALKLLHRAGAGGCEPVNWPGTRWSGYVHQLRGLGIDIETVREPHGGDFPGSHARYVLRSTIILVSPEPA